MSTREHLIDLLTTLPEDRDVRVFGDKVRLRCPNPRHAGGQERTPSLFIFLDPADMGRCKCFGCGIGGSWRETTSRLLGLRAADVPLGDIVTPSFSAKEEASLLGATYTRPHSYVANQLEAWPSGSEWRGIPGSLVAAVGGRLVLDSRLDRGHPILRLPVVVRGVEEGHVDCKLNPSPDEELKYLNSTGRWTKDALHPYDFIAAMNPKVLALVEGPRDDLITIRNGLPTLSILGATNWSPRCAKLVLALAPAILLLMMDPDDAGQRVQRLIYHDLSPHLRVVPVLLPHKFGVRNGQRVMLKLLDPGDLNRRQLQHVCDRVGVSLHQELFYENPSHRPLRKGGHSRFEAASG